MTNPAEAVQPEPRPAGGRPIWELVREDMLTRDQVGAAKYGVRLQAGNGRDALLDAYQEALDLVVYLRQALEERAQGAQRASQGPQEAAAAAGEGLHPTPGLRARLGAVLGAMQAEGCGLTGHQEAAIRRALELWP